MWNYRVVKSKQKDDTYLYKIQEIYYEADGKTIKGYCPASVEDWETLKDLRGTLEKMLDACDKPVIGD